MADILPEHMRQVHLFLMASHDEAQSKQTREKTRDYLKPYIMESGEEDERGNYILYFDEPLTIDGVTYTGLMAQRKVSEYVDEEKARELICNAGLTGSCIRVVEVSEVDYDALYAANQEGLVSDEEIDSIIETNVSYALTKVKG